MTSTSTLSSSSTSSQIFLHRLSQLFLWTTIFSVVCLIVLNGEIPDHARRLWTMTTTTGSSSITTTTATTHGHGHDHDENSDAGIKSSLWSSTDALMTTTTTAVNHKWSLKQFGFPSAFEDVLYHQSSSPTLLLPSASFRNMEIMSQSQTQSQSQSPSHPQHQLCEPQRLHMTQASDVWKRKKRQIDDDVGNDDNSNILKDDDAYYFSVNMTLSFTLKYPYCQNAQVTVYYGTGGRDHHNDNDNDDDDKESTRIVEGSSTEGEVRQFHYDASLAIPEWKNRLYQSDYIHHMVLPFLHAGQETYWYKIQVDIDSNKEKQNHNDNDVDNDNNNDNDNLSSTSSLSSATKSEVVHHLRTVSHPIKEVDKSQPKRVYFKTPPLPHQPTALALVGDLGQTENSTKTMHHIYNAVIAKKKKKNSKNKNNNNNDQNDQNDDDKQQDFDVPVSALLIAGDLSYADGDPRRWESWLELMEPLLRTVPMFSVPGNHEIECDRTTSDVFQLYENFFRNPNRLGEPDIKPIPAAYRRILWSCLTSSEFMGHYNYGNAFWTVRHGMVQIIGLNSYTSSLPGSPQYTWFVETLEQVDRSVTPWVIVTFHTPLHTTFFGHNRELNPMVMLHTLEPVMVEHHVNLVISGHDHAYLRTHPMVGDQVDSQGPVYWTLGAGGNREQHSKGYIHKIPEEWVDKRELSEYGYGHFFAANATHARLTWMRDGTAPNSIRDDVWMKNQYYQLSN